MSRRSAPPGGRRPKADPAPADLPSLLAAWRLACEVDRDAVRRAGLARFRLGPDRWIDPPRAAEAQALAHQLAGAALERGVPVSVLRAFLAAAIPPPAADPPSPPPRATPVLALVARPWAGLDPAGSVIELTADVPADGDADVELLIGDNRDALRWLADRGVTLDAVLEDPPYDTGKRDLPYRDAWPEGAWLAILREHLALAHERLAPHGLLALHIDEHRAEALLGLLREGWGEAQVLGMQIWDKRNPKGDAGGLANRHELLVWACRDRRVLQARGGLVRPKPNARRMLQQAAAFVAELGLPEARRAWARWVSADPGLSGGERAYRLLDDDGRPYRPVSMAWPNRTLPGPEHFVPLIHPVTGLPCPVPERGWRNRPATMQQLLAEGRILFGPDEQLQPTRKYLLADVLTEAVPSVVEHAGSDDRLLAALGLRFPHAKPVAVLQELLDIAAPREGAVVFDGFAGSGSLAHAALGRLAAGGPRIRVVLAEQDLAVVEAFLLPRLRAALTAPRWERGLPAGEGVGVVVRVWRVKGGEEQVEAALPIRGS